MSWIFCAVILSQAYAFDAAIFDKSSFATEGEERFDASIFDDAVFSDADNPRFDAADFDRCVFPSEPAAASHPAHRI
ncbi:MAG: hypothetical protein JNN26_19265 [Candidatus Obscuribacter sp.]|nr:hypothetical protein [Candidatus Obscuribacter sp.]